MYFAGSKKSVRFAEFSRKLQFCSAGNGPLLRADVYSGDGNPASQPLGTFNPLFPRGAYFAPKAVPFLGLTSESGRLASGPSIPAEAERYWGFCLELVLAGINPQRHICVWQWSPD